MRENSLTEGNILPSLLLFSLPLIVGNFFQTFYNIADSIIVGRFIGPEALAAVGSAYSLMTFLTSLMIGLCMGAGIAFSYAYGAKDFEKLKASLGLSFLLIAIITFVVFAFSCKVRNYHGYQAYVSTLQDQACPHARLSGPFPHQGRSRCSGSSPPQGTSHSCSLREASSSCRKTSLEQL